MRELYLSLRRLLRAMVGIPDYETYLAHVSRQHPGRRPMSYEEFFRDRQEHRYGGGASRCC